MELYDGGSTSSSDSLLGRFCQGSPLEEPRFSTGNQMFVMFHPGQTVDRGFEAEYSVSTPTSTTSPSTTLETTNESETTSELETTSESETSMNIQN